MEWLHCIIISHSNPLSRAWKCSGSTLNSKYAVYFSKDCQGFPVLMTPCLQPISTPWLQPRHTRIAASTPAPCRAAAGNQVLRPGSTAGHAADALRSVRTRTFQGTSNQLGLKAETKASAKRGAWEEDKKGEKARNAARMGESHLWNNLESFY